MIINSILYYMIFVPSILIYGIGMQKLTFQPSIDHLFLTFAKLLLCTLIASALSYLVTVYILAPLTLVSLMPITCLLMYLVFSLLSSLAFFKFGTKSVLEVSFPIIFISVNESTSLLQCIVVDFSMCVFFAIIMLVFCALIKRLKSTHPIKEFNTGSVIFISIAILIIAFYGANISWLTMLK